MLQSTLTAKRPLLNLNESEAVLTCDMCWQFAHSGNNAFVKGARYFRPDGTKHMKLQEISL